jgi:hypothetical protein
MLQLLLVAASTIALIAPCLICLRSGALAEEQAAI